MEQSGDNTAYTGTTPHELAIRLARGDAMRGSVTPILRHMLLHDDNALFSDEIIARVHGMLRHLAVQVLTVYARADGVSDPEDYAINGADEFCEYLSADEDLLGHVHALALETRLAGRLRERGIVDPVVPPLVQGLVAAREEAVAQMAMSYLAAEAKFLQQSQRMELPIGQLPDDYFHLVISTLQAYAGDEGAAAASRTAEMLCSSYSEAQTRLGLAMQLVAGLGQNARAALAIDHSGVSLFLTAIAMASDQNREPVVMACNDMRASRLGLSLKAAGLQLRDIEAQFAYLEVDPALAENFEAVSAAQASTLLADQS